MGKRIDDEKIALIKKIYSECGTYSQTAKKVGCSPSTVKKYVTTSSVLAQNESIIEIPFMGEIPPVNFEMFRKVKDNWGELCVLYSKELLEIKELQKEIVI